MHDDTATGSEIELVGERDGRGSLPVRGFEQAREPMPTLPDGIPSSLWEEAVESERRSNLSQPRVRE